jgi:predicted choloylglycine hydrolase
MRPRSPRPSLLALACAFFLAPAALAGDPFRFPEGKHGKGELRYVQGIPVLTVEGTPEEIGEQAAVLAGRPSRRLLTYPKEAVDRLASPAVSKLLWPTIHKQGERLLANFPPDHHRELDAMIKATGYDRELIVTANTIFDLKYLFLPLLAHCSAVVVEGERSRTGQPLFGRNMDYHGMGYLHEYGLVTVYRPKGKYAFAAVGYPGLVGVVSGINEKGLAVTALETTGAPKEEGPPFSAEGTPFLLCYRRLLEECATVAEAEKLLKAMKRTTTNNLTVCDKNGGAVFEFTPSRVAVRRPEQGLTTCTNHFCAPELKLAQPKNVATTLDRFAALARARDREKQLGVAEVQKYLDDANQGLETLQTMIFEPASLVVHLAFSDGVKPSTALKLNRLELGPLLKAEGRSR